MTTGRGRRVTGGMASDSVACMDPTTPQSDG
jgi:hypothetical protein